MHLAKDLAKTDPNHHLLGVELERLFGMLNRTGYRREDCETIAPLTLEINRLKRETNTLILAHHYMTPDLVFGVADFAEDALGLVRRAQQSKAETIIACGVWSLAEMIKIGSPEKRVICPDRAAGCSVVDSMSVSDVQALRQKYPERPTVAYVTTSAEVKAISDYVVTSANVHEVVARIPANEIIFYPDQSLGKTLQMESGKEVAIWNGTCVVHDGYSLDQVINFRKQHPEVAVLFHSEVDPSLYAHGDMTGGTSVMKRFVSEHPEIDKFFMVTECGLSDQLRVEFPEKKFIGTCSLCPYMKTINLENTLAALKGELSAENEVTFSERVFEGIMAAYIRTEALLAN